MEIKISRSKGKRKEREAGTATGMDSKGKARLRLLLILTLLSSLRVRVSVCHSEDPEPVPVPWPLQFHSVLLMNYSGILQIIDLWYDWPNGRNFNIIQHQLGNVVYDLEWNNGTSFFYTLDSSQTCSTSQLEVGILRPNWLDGANYLGQHHVDGFLCNVWEKVDFIWYYEDVHTKRPVHWLFYTGRQAHVMTFEVGAVLEDDKWQAPPYCFDGKGAHHHHHNNLPVVDGALRAPFSLHSKTFFFLAHLLRCAV